MLQQQLDGLPWNFSLNNFGDSFCYKFTFFPHFEFMIKNFVFSAN